MCNNACQISPIINVISPIAIFTRGVSNWLILICGIELKQQIKI